MTDLSAHKAAVNKMRRLAKERNCIVQVRPVRGGSDHHDVYAVVDFDTGVIRGEIRAAHRALDRVDLDAFFAKEMIG